MTVSKSPNEIEMATLGAAMTCQKHAPEVLDEIITILPDIGAFGEKRHRDIYRAIRSLYSKAETVDLVTVGNALGENKLKTVGGRAYLAELCDTAGSPHSGISYARTLADKARRRKLVETAQEVIAADKAPEATAAKLSDIFERGFTAIADGATAKVHHIKDAAPEYAARLLGDAKEDGAKFLPTRIHVLNNKLGGGLRRGHLVVVGGLPSTGKSSFALDVVMYNGNLGKQSLVFSLDETLDDIWRRAFQANMGLDHAKLSSRGPWDQTERNKIEIARDSLVNQTWSGVDASGMTAMTIRTKARAYKRKYGQLDMVVIDYIGQIRPPRGFRNQTREREMAEIAVSLKELAKELDCCVIAVSQLNRTMTKEQLLGISKKKDRFVPRPHKGHLKDSGEYRGGSQRSCSSPPAQRVPARTSRRPP